MYIYILVSCLCLMAHQPLLNIQCRILFYIKFFSLDYIVFQTSLSLSLSLFMYIYWSVGCVLWHINPCWIFNAESSFTLNSFLWITLFFKRLSVCLSLYVYILVSWLCLIAYQPLLNIQCIMLFIYTFIKFMICKWLVWGNITFICLHTVKNFQALLCNTNNFIQHYSFICT